jgi:hypothetical protein
MAAAIAPVAIGLTVASTMVGAYGEAQGQKFEAAQKKQQAEAGRIAADQTDTVLNQELTSTLASIRSIRASAGADPNSATTRAIMDEETRTQNRTRRIERGNRLRQANMDDASAKFLKQSARVSLLGGALKSAAIGTGQYVNYYGVD